MKQSTGFESSLPCLSHAEARCEQSCSTCNRDSGEATTTTKNGCHQDRDNEDKDEDEDEGDEDEDDDDNDDNEEKDDHHEDRRDDDQYEE